MLCWRVSLYRVFREFYEINPDSYIKMVKEAEKIIYHDTLDVLRSVHDIKEEQDRLVRLVTVCTKSANCGEALREIAQIHKDKSRWLSDKWPEDAILSDYNVAAILGIYK